MADIKFTKSYGLGYPEKCEEVLDCVTYAVVCCFNRPGSLLAVGCNDGRILIWDSITLNIIKSVSIHVRPITSIRYGEFLMLGSSDWSVSILNGINLDLVTRLQFTCQVTFVEFNPRNKCQALVCSHLEFPCVINIPDSNRSTLIDSQTSFVEKSFVARFDRRGKMIFVANGKGDVIIYNSETLNSIRRFCLRTHKNTPVAALHIEFSHTGPDSFLVNCTDRIIRMFRCSEVIEKRSKIMDPEKIFQDLVSRSIWRKCCFTNDGEYIVAGASRYHSIYIWERVTGGLVKILNGPESETLCDITCHPTRPIICSVSNGLVSVWCDTYPECWSAYAPKFVELEQNLEYEERENEFDIKDEDKAGISTKESPENVCVDINEKIDIFTREIPLHCSSDEDGNEEHVYTQAIVAEDYFPDKSDCDHV